MQRLIWLQHKRAMKPKCRTLQLNFQVAGASNVAVNALSFRARMALVTRLGEGGESGIAESVLYMLAEALLSE
jgi:hypothetical protein